MPNLPWILVEDYKQGAGWKRPEQRETRARAYCAASGAYLVPFGADMPEAIAAIADAAGSLKLKPDEVWCASGSVVSGPKFIVPRQIGLTRSAVRPKRRYSIVGSSLRGAN